MTPEKAKEILHTQYPYYGVMMVKMGMQDGDGIRCMPFYSRYTSSMPSDPEDKTGNQACIRILPDSLFRIASMVQTVQFVFADSGLNLEPDLQDRASFRAYASL